MAGLLLSLPSWFNPWGWVAIGVVALIILVILLVCIIRSGKKKDVEEPAQVETVKDEQEPVAEEPAQAEPVKEEPVKEEPAPAEEKAEEPKEEVKEEPEEAKAEEEEVSEEEGGEEEPEEEKPADKPVKKTTKPATKTYHISKRKDDNKWQVKAAGGAKALKLFNTQAEAIDYAKALAKSQEARIVIHKEDGSFRKITY